MFPLAKGLKRSSSVTGKPSAFLALLCAILLPSLSFSTTFWQTTQIGTSSGQCQLESNKIRVIANAFYLDIEEEATILAKGNVNWGDPATLEIVGEFQLTPGTALRSMLLWNGNQILKAKLRDRIAADSMYEAIVDRDKPKPVVRDPALIEYLGGNKYRYKIYPVAINSSRKIRILYTVPLQAFSTGPRFRIQTAFTLGAAENPDQIPVELVKGESAFETYRLQYGDTRKTVQFGATYQIPRSVFHSQQYFSWYGGSSGTTTPAALTLIPDSSDWSHAYGHHIASGNAAGYYAAIFSTMPDSIRTALRALRTQRFTLEAKVIAGEMSYIADLPYQGCFGIYLKSTTPWDGNVYWTAYDSLGKAVAAFTEEFGINSACTSSGLLPLVWGAKYTLEEAAGSAGALMGFVDGRMSLLAVEADSMAPNESEKWTAKGVPPLLPSEIIVVSSRLPTIPREDVIFEFQTGLSAKSDATAVVGITTISKGRVKLTLGGNVRLVSAILFDFRGRKILAWNNVPTAGGSVEFCLPSNLRGAYILQITSAGKMIGRRSLFLK